MDELSKNDSKDPEIRWFLQRLDVYPLAFLFMVPVYSCPDEERLGGAFDGGKWVCGIERLSQNCVVYSYGSMGNDRFERDVKKIAPRCDIHTFDPGNYEGSVASGTVVTYHKTGLAPETNARGNYRSFQDDAASLGHKHIDILKIDIEGAEYGVLPAIFKRNGDVKMNPMPSIGQLQVEIHVIPGVTHPAQRVGRHRRVGFGPAAHRSLVDLLAMLHRANMYLFHVEVNLDALFAIELAFVNVSTLPEPFRPRCPF